jgi:hypothetical protein
MERAASLPSASTDAAVRSTRPAAAVATAEPTRPHPGPRGLSDEHTGLPDEFDTLHSAALAVLAAVREAHEWDAITRRQALAGLERAANTLLVAKGKVVSAEQAAGTWGLKGDRDLAGFLGRESHQGREAGVAAVGRAATLAALPVVADALVDGPVTARHLDEVTRATTSSPLLAAQLATPAGQAQVIELAGRLDGAAFARQLRQMSASLDPASKQRDHDAQRAERFLHITPTPSGTLFKGRLDSVAGYKLVKAIDALNPRPALDDARDRGQRQADALTLMAERILADRAATPGAVAPVQAVVTLSESTWTALRAAHHTGTAGERRDMTDGAGSTPAVTREPSPGSAADVVTRLRGMTPVTDEDGRAWPASEIGRALCDCALTRAVTNATGQTLDLGRSRRLFTQNHWLALLAAGHTTCAVPGCAIPLRYCELHHITWWGRDGGSTTLTNCVPLCSYHHHETHRRDLHITRRTDGNYQFHHPDERPYGDHPDERRHDGAPPGSGMTPPVDPTGPPRGDAVPGGTPPGGVASPGRGASPGRRATPRGGAPSDRTGRAATTRKDGVVVSAEQPALWTT